MKLCLISNWTLVGVLLTVSLLTRPANADPNAAQKPDQGVIDLEAYIYSTLRKGKALSHPQWPYSITVTAVHGKTLIAPVLTHRASDGTIDGTTYAKDGTLHVDGNRKLILELNDGAGSGQPDGGRTIFDKKTWYSKLPVDFGKP